MNIFSKFKSKVKNSDKNMVSDSLDTFYLTESLLNKPINELLTNPDIQNIFYYKGTKFSDYYSKFSQDKAKYGIQYAVASSKKLLKYELSRNEQFALNAAELLNDVNPEYNISDGADEFISGYVNTHIGNSNDYDKFIVSSFMDTSELEYSRLNAIKHTKGLSEFEKQKFNTLNDKCHEPIKYFEGIMNENHAWDKSEMVDFKQYLTSKQNKTDIDKTFIEIFNKYDSVKDKLGSKNLLDERNYRHLENYYILIEVYNASNRDISEWDKASIMSFKRLNDIYASSLDAIRLTNQRKLTDWENAFLDNFLQYNDTDRSKNFADMIAMNELTCKISNYYFENQVKNIEKYFTTYLADYRKDKLSKWDQIAIQKYQSLGNSFVVFLWATRETNQRALTDWENAFLDNFIQFRDENRARNFADIIKIDIKKH